MPRRVAPLLLIGLASCGAPDAATWVELGAGRTAFEPLTDTIEIVSGPQGGWHVDVTLRFGGVSPEGTLLRYTAQDADTGQTLSFLTEALLTEDSVTERPDGSWERVGDRIVLDIDSAIEAADRVLDLIIEVEPALGEPLEARHEVTVIDEVNELG